MNRPLSDSPEGEGKVRREKASPPTPLQRARGVE